jgi:hypothetical protein
LRGRPADCSGTHVILGSGKNATLDGKEMACEGDPVSDGSYLMAIHQSHATHEVDGGNGVSAAAAYQAAAAVRPKSIQVADATPNITTEQAAMLAQTQVSDEQQTVHWETVEVFILDSFPNPKSMFGHVAIAIDDIVYSRAHEKYAVLTRGYIADQQKKRKVIGYLLSVTKDERHKIETELKRRVAVNARYDLANNSCSSNIADVLEMIGVTAYDPRGFGIVSPSDLAVGLPRSGRLIKTVRYPEIEGMEPSPKGAE